nr:sigma factor-like helix-turn-helix DNA-binding protein [Myxococcota bacterium]
PEEHGVAYETPHHEVFEIPPSRWGWPLEVLELSVRIQQILTRAGITKVGDLNGISLYEIEGCQGIGIDHLQNIESVVKQFLEIPNLSVDELTRDGRFQPPRLPVRVLRDIVEAKDVEEETSALFTMMSERDALLARARWTFKRGRNETLEELGSEWGITRERVRQLVNRNSQKLKDSGLRLPKCAKIVEIVEQAGGAMSSERLISKAAELDLTVTKNDLELIQGLSAFDITGGSLRYENDVYLWLSKSGIALWSDTTWRSSIRRKVRKQGMKSLGETSSVSRKVIQTSSPFGFAHSIAVLFDKDPQSASMLEVGDHLVPLPVQASNMTRLISKTIFVTGPILFADLIAGLRTAPRFTPPPAEVIQSVLKNHPSFVEIEGRWTLAEQICGCILSGSEQAALEIFKRNEGVMLFWDFIDQLEEAGYSYPTGALILRMPFIIRRSTGVYALRGRDVSASLVREKIAERKAARRNSVLSVREIATNEVEVQFRLNRWGLQGVLGLPSELRKLQRSQWQGRLPTGEVVELTIDHGFIWSLSSWFKSQGATEGMVVVASFYLSEGVVEFDELMECQ